MNPVLPLSYKDIHVIQVLINTVMQIYEIKF